MVTQAPTSLGERKAQLLLDEISLNMRLSVWTRDRLEHGGDLRLQLLRETFDRRMRDLTAMYVALLAGGPA